MRGSTFDFERVLSVTQEDKTTEVYEDKEHAPMILLDAAEGTPIFAVSVAGQGGRVLMTKRKGGSFQAIFEKDKQKFAFRVSNLSDHRISFSIRRGDAKGPAINKVNLIDPKKTVEIVSDFSNGEREMFLDTLEEKVSVAQDEARPDGSAAKGSYFSIVAYPTNKEADWTKAVWGCPDFVCFPVAPPPSPGFGGDFPSYSGGGWGGERGACKFFLMGNCRKGSLCAFSHAPQGWGSGGGHVVEGFGASVPRPVPCFSASAAGGGGGFGGYSFGGFGDSAPVRAGGGAALLPAEFTNDPSMALAFVSGGGDDYDLAEFGAYEDDAMAANVRHGDTRVQSTRTVNCDVFYKQGSSPTTLCLSVMKPEKVSIFAKMTDAARLHKMLENLYDFIMGKNERLLASLTQVFSEEQCVVCMDSPPQCIFIKCGHAALCNGCKPQLKEQKCPLCRGHISASIQK